MRRHAGGAGCGARVAVSQTEPRVVSEHRPHPSQDGGCLRWLDVDRMKGGQVARLDRGEAKASSVRSPEERPRRETPPVERREVRVPVTTARGPLREVPSCYPAPFGAPLPHVGEGKESDGAPRADQTTGPMNHACTEVAV